MVGGGHSVTFSALSFSDRVLDPQRLAPPYGARYGRARDLRPTVPLPSPPGSVATGRDFCLRVVPPHWGGGGVSGLWVGG